jgi:hypothetical protein
MSCHESQPKERTLLLFSDNCSNCSPFSYYFPHSASGIAETLFSLSVLQVAVCDLERPQGRVLLSCCLAYVSFRCGFLCIHRQHPRNRIEPLTDKRRPPSVHVQPNNALRLRPHITFTLRTSSSLSHGSLTFFLQCRCRVPQGAGIPYPMVPCTFPKPRVRRQGVVWLHQ